MSSAGSGGGGTGARLAARLVALRGVAPDPVRHVIFRSTRRIDGTLVEGYSVPGETALLDTPGLENWLARQQSSIDRLAVAVMVIREILDTRGLVLQCTIERRRGSAEGPFCGDPVRVEFAGAASAVRLYRGRPDGRLIETAPTADSSPPRLRVPEHFAGEHRAIEARFGEAVRVLDTREPTLFEDMVGLSSITHIRTPEGREVGCGIGWHGDMAFVLEADFPRHAVALDLLEEDAAAVDAAARMHGLVRGEARLDARGLVVLARRRGSEDLFLLRPSAGDVRIEPYTASRDLGGPDQQRWMRYAETYEGLTVLDAWRDGDSDDLLVLTGDSSGQIWRHHVDIDGVETWRKAIEDAAIGGLHRERLFPGALSLETADPAGHGDAGESEALSEAPPPGSLLAVGETYQRAMTALREARDAAADPSSGDAAARVLELREALDALDAHVSAALVRPDPAILERMEERLRAELSLIRCVIVPLPYARLLRGEAAVSESTAAAVPGAAYDVEEAAMCLALRRPTASVYHCMRVIERGISVLARRSGAADPLATGERDWQIILRLLRGAAQQGLGDALEALGGIRRRWRSSRLTLADKYTEQEAELIFEAVGAFLRALA
ncbi:MAG: hypothetical protein WDN25_16380 [Acetobacteraceae bacterium]